jgi:hypothetical protein
MQVCPVMQPNLGDLFRMRVITKFACVDRQVILQYNQPRVGTTRLM